MHALWYSYEHASKTDSEVVVFLHKKCSRSFLTIRLNHRCPIDYFINVLITLGLERVSCIAV